MFSQGISFSYLFKLSDNFFEMFYPVDHDISDSQSQKCCAWTPAWYIILYLFKLSDEYFEMSYPMDISITNIQVCIRDIFGVSSFYFATGPCRLLLLRTRVDTAFFAPFTTVMVRRSVAATDRPPRRGLPRPNCHSHWFTS